MPAVQAYCFKCRTKRNITNMRPTRMKNGRAAAQGTCPICRTKVFRIGKL